MELTSEALRRMKSGKPIPMLTAYTAPVARALERAGIPVILVGDTVGMVEMRFDSTRSITLENMRYHIGAVRRGAPETHVIGDLPYATYDEPGKALASARALIDAGADSVKLEGPGLTSFPTSLSGGSISSGIPVLHRRLRRTSSKLDVPKMRRGESLTRRSPSRRPALHGCPGTHSGIRSREDYRGVGCPNHWDRWRHNVRWSGAGHQ